MVALLLSISACKINGEEETEMLPNDEKVHAYCVGRNILDMPASFSQSKVTTGVFREARMLDRDPAIEVTVSAMGWTKEQFALGVSKRRNELKDAAHETVNVLQFEKTFNDEATLFHIRRIEDAYVSEINLLRGTHMIAVRLKSYHGQFLAAEERLVRFAAGIVEKDKGDSSMQPSGFCLGPVLVAGEFNEEVGNFHFNDRKGDTFSAYIDSYKADPEVPLLERVNGPDSLLSKFSVNHTVLRAGQRSVANMRAQEWLAWAKLGQQGDEKTFAFSLETVRPKPGKSTPHLHLSLDTGQALEDGTPTKTNMSDDEVLRLWESVVKSIRPATR
jgi:hypothetical protein